MEFLVTMTTQVPDGTPGQALWRARDAAVMQAILGSLPLYGWMTTQTRPLIGHPSDPAIARS